MEIPALLSPSLYLRSAVYVLQQTGQETTLPREGLRRDGHRRGSSGGRRGRFVRRSADYPLRQVHSAGGRAFRRTAHSSYVPLVERNLTPAQTMGGATPRAENREREIAASGYKPPCLWQKTYAAKRAAMVHPTLFEAHRK
ncbi:hypothetical protein SKAU_G00024350 [Synaphobranchus kaupii]|uniref:Uncharacterized protein n=1 Tax=Synaphobranchus kaupii TaxID=118154 RepID=A0A9Q1JES4_SYNKA|nr:hypothetical protein SKAU_G00024350 [Synaphobranchus kaupii]